MRRTDSRPTVTKELSTGTAGVRLHPAPPGSGSAAHSSELLKALARVLARQVAADAFKTFPSPETKS